MQNAAFKAGIFPQIMKGFKPKNPTRTFCKKGAILMSPKLIFFKGKLACIFRTTAMIQVMSTMGLASGGSKKLGKIQEPTYTLFFE